MFFSDGLTVYDCDTLNEKDANFVNDVTCPVSGTEAVGSLTQTLSDNKLNDELKVTIDVVVSVLLTIFCLATMFICTVNTRQVIPRKIWMMV